MHTGVVSYSPQPNTADEASSAYRETRRSQSAHAVMTVDPVVYLQSLEEDVQRDVASAQQRAKLLQEEVDSLLTRIADTQESTVAAQSDADPVMQKIEAIRKLRQE